MKEGDRIEFVRDVAGATELTDILRGSTATARYVAAVHDGWSFDAHFSYGRVSCGLVTRENDPLVRIYETCGKPLRRVNFYREVVDDVCTAEAGHDGTCITHMADRYITVTCYVCEKP